MAVHIVGFGFSTNYFDEWSSSLASFSRSSTSLSSSSWVLLVQCSSLATKIFTPPPLLVNTRTNIGYQCRAVHWTQWTQWREWNTVNTMNSVKHSEQSATQWTHCSQLWLLYKHQYDRHSLRTLSAFQPQIEIQIHKSNKSGEGLRQILNYK